MVLPFPIRHSICNINTTQITTTTVVTVNITDCVRISLAPITNTNEPFVAFHVVVVIVILVVVVVVLVAVRFVAAGSGGAAVPAPIACVRGFPAAGAVAIDAPAELRALCGEEPVALHGEHLFVNEPSEFPGFWTRVPDPALRGPAVEAQRVVMEDEWGAETGFDPLVGDETDVFGGHGCE